MKLYLCCGCNRHVKDDAATCPFCGANVADEPCLDGSRPALRMSRAAMMVGASTMIALASCSSYGQGPYCPNAVAAFSPCGFDSVTTTCAGASVQCDTTLCTVFPVKADCTVTVVLHDHSTHSISVTVGSASNCPGDVVLTPRTGIRDSTVDFTSPTCQPKPGYKLDAAADVDASSDAEAQTDDASDAPLD